MHERNPSPSLINSTSLGQLPLPLPLLLELDDDELLAPDDDEEELLPPVDDDELLPPELPPPDGLGGTGVGGLIHFMALSRCFSSSAMSFKSLSTSIMNST